MGSLLDPTTPLTIERVLKSSDDTLFVVFDFTRDGWDEQIQALKAYWRAWAGNHSVQRVFFLFTDDPASIEHRALKKGNYVVYGLFDPKPNHLVFASFKDTPFSTLEDKLKDSAESEMGDVGLAGVGRNPLGEGALGDCYGFGGCF